MALWSIIFACYIASSSGTIARLELGGKIFTTNINYASWNIDASYNRGFFHMNFSNPNMRAAAASLAPSTVRFGGTGNDYLHYDCETVPGMDNDTYGCLNATQRADLFGLASTTGTDFLFGVSFDIADACTKGPLYIWSSKDVKHLISEMAAAGQTVWGFELGNEINNRSPGGNQDCGLMPSQQSDAMLEFSALLKSHWPEPENRPKFVGPDTGSHNASTWLNATLAAAGGVLHAVTHHVYPGIKRYNYNIPSELDKIIDGDMSWYGDIVKSQAPSAEMWAGEDGPAGGGESGTCSGTTGDPHNVSACGLYATVLWYADEMALRAANGFKQYQRQDFVGGRYSLIGTEHDNQFEPYSSSVTIHPDFWINFLWKRTMGRVVLNTTTTMFSSNKTLRGYAHCGKPPSEHRVSSSNSDESLTVLLVNLDDTSNYTDVIIPGMKSSYSWSLTPGNEGVFGSSARLNGMDLPTMLSDGKPINKVPALGVKGAGPIISVPPLSVTFVIVKSHERQNPCQIKPINRDYEKPHIGASSKHLYHGKIADTIAGCANSDMILTQLRDVLCKSLSTQCTTVHPAPNITSQGDWPSQAVYMNDLLTAIASVPKAYNASCLRTQTAKHIIEWLADTRMSTPWWNTWLIFQVQYFDMPRLPGTRIESAATLGRKCWAFSYLKDIWVRLKPALSSAMSRSGNDLLTFFDTWENAVSKTMPLCNRVLANCFMNASYDPSLRNGTCPSKVAAFYVGWEWENLGGGREPNVPRSQISYPFPNYAQTDTSKKSTDFAVDTVLNEII